MLVLELVLIVVLQFEGTRGGDLYLYHRSGDDVVLPCSSSSSNYSCPIVDWFYFRDRDTSILWEIQDGKVDQTSPRAARLNVDNNCSLIIININADDAGVYICEFGPGTFDDWVLLSVLTISPSPPGADLTKDGDFTLQCSLERYSELGPCPEKSLLWVNETGSELLGEGVGFKSGGQTGCDSYLTVKLQSSSNRTYTCQFVEDNTVKIEAHYTPVFKGVPANRTIMIVIFLGAVIGVLLLMVLGAVFMKLKKTRVKENHRTTTDQDSTHEVIMMSSRTKTQ